MNTNDVVRRYIAEKWHTKIGGEALEDDYPLLEQGVLDSVGILDLVDFLESEFGIELDDEELLPSNFNSVAAIASLVESKRG